MNEEIDLLLKNLKKRNFIAEFYFTGAEAKKALAEHISSQESVGIGGSMTIFEMGIHKELQERGNKVFWHWLVGPNERDEARQKAAAADVYLSSTNAVTMKGELVNIDGTGNRVSSMFYGPKKVFIICGINKIVEDYQAAIERIKSTTCPQNARRLKLDTPCAKTGKCNDCSSPHRMCNVTVKLDQPTSGKEIHILIVGESLGY